MDSELKIALMEGYEAALAESGFLPGFAKKALTIGALLAGTIFSGCSAGGNQKLKVDIPENTPATRDSVTELALKLADGIRTEMNDSVNVVEDTESWKAIKKVYKELNQGDTKPLADAFSRVINDSNKKKSKLLAPTCCDDTAYNNKENNTVTSGGTYNAEDNTWEY